MVCDKEIEPAQFERRKSHGWPNLKGDFFTGVVRMPTSFWRSVADKFWLACFVAGIFLSIIGATGTVPYVTQPVANVYFQILLFGVGLALIALGAYARMSAPEIDSDKKKVGESRTINAKTYGVVITTPKEGAKVVSPVQIQGTIKTRLGDLELWLVNVGDVSGEPAYWPQRKVYPGTNNKWSVTYTPVPGFRNGDRRRLRLYLVGKDGQALITAFRKTHEEFAMPQKLPWIGLTRLTADMVQAGATLQIILTSPEPSRPDTPTCSGSS
jgi:hypothetical protein